MPPTSVAGAIINLMSSWWHSPISITMKTSAFSNKKKTTNLPNFVAHEATTTTTKRMPPHLTANTSNNIHSARNVWVPHEKKSLYLNMLNSYTTRVICAILCTSACVCLLKMLCIILALPFFCLFLLIGSWRHEGVSAVEISVRQTKKMLFLCFHTHTLIWIWISLMYMWRVFIYSCLTLHEYHTDRWVVGWFILLWYDAIDAYHLRHGAQSKGNSIGWYLHLELRFLPVIFFASQ